VYTIDLTFVGRGIHEELVAYVADQQDYYAKEGVHVALRDGRAWDVDRVRRTATIGLGRAVVSTVTDGVPWVVLCVNTQHPLFWLLARESFTTIEALKGGWVGIHAPRTAPGCFARIALRKHGLDPDRDVQCVVMPPGDYSRHLRALADGSLDAAFVGSTVAPEVAARDHGLRVLAFMGDDLQVPTVGVAIDPTHISPDDPAVRALVRANRRALRAIHDEPQLAARYINALIPNLSLAQARQHYERYVAPYFTTDGRHDPAVAARALSAVARELAAPTTRDAADIYRTQLPDEPSWSMHNEWPS
jgi:ABC-type nitrate/sulfonate/bicarbonate transport system substrate-binding protein